MRYAVVSDIHSNLEAFQVALGRLEGDDHLLCLGDIVGYGPNPNECLELLRGRINTTVLGNHDVAAIDNFGIEWFNPAAREAIRWTQGVLNAENKAWLNTLGYEYRDPAFLMVHGAPSPDYFEYILDKDTARKAFDSTDAPLILIGHTHIAEMYALAADGTISHRHFQNGGTVELDPAFRYIVNVGSVGQPRDLNPQASFGFYQPDERRIEVTRFDYPIAAVQEKIECAHLPEVLARRLGLGR
ncbi:MAG: metallophosphoesterase family protein [Candidatus Eremiobacteraeota bacterium]|nr:metallophosphoesterase family protein [Candidatus Eremiobacteraeota bacterium]